MKAFNRTLVAGLTFLFWLATNPALAADRTGDFALLDQDGYFHQMSWYGDHRLVAILTQANGDALFENSIAEFSGLESRFGDAGVVFFLLNPQGAQDRAAIAAERSRLGITLPVLMDDAQIVSEALGVEFIGEAILYNPRTFTVEYHGPVGPGFEQALTRLLSDNEVADARLPVPGEAVRYLARETHDQATPSYETEIAPIIAENCASCHREGGIAPFALNSHTMVQGWSPMIREVLMTKRMPPGQVDPHIGDFENAMVLSDAHVQKLVHWIEAGAPVDGVTDPLQELTWPESRWAFGEPDYIIKIPPQEVPATGVLDYYNVVVPVEIENDRWVRASQYIPGDRTVLHHTLHSIIPPGATRGGSLLGGEPDRPNIAPYIPGQSPRMEPPNTGGLLKAGSRIAMQMHYTTTGKATVDASEIGVWFYPEGFVPEERMTGECACIFTPTWENIPPFDPDYEMSTSFTIERDARIFALTPHMHFRGKRMRFYADYPDGSREELINIANYNYNWQLAYTYKEPKPVPAGTVITAVGAFDNSARNPANPDPSRSVPWGLQSWDEMFFGALDWKYEE